MLVVPHAPRAGQQLLDSSAGRVSESPIFPGPVGSPRHRATEGPEHETRGRYHSFAFALVLASALAFPPARRVVFFFGGGTCEIDTTRDDIKHILGGKGASLAAMTCAGLPVPPGFTISVEACKHFHDNDGEWPKDLKEQIM